MNLKTRHGRGAEISNITYENLNAKIQNWFDEDDRWFRGILCMDQFYGDQEIDMDTKATVDEGTSTIQNILVKNISMEVTNRPSIYLCGLPENHIKNVTLSNIKIKGGDGFFIKNVDGLNLYNVESLREI